MLEVQERKIRDVALRAKGTGDEQVANRVAGVWEEVMRLVKSLSKAKDEDEDYLIGIEVWDLCRRRNKDLCCVLSIRFE